MHVYGYTAMSVITPPRKSGDGGCRHSVVHMLPWFILTASLLLWGSNLLHTSCSHEVEKLRYDIGQHLLDANHRLIDSVSATPGSQTWQLSASCNATMEHVRLLEGLLDPRALLQKLVQQKEGAWLQIGSNTMDNHNSNDPMLKLLQAVPTWKKVFVEPIPSLFAKLEQSIQRWPNSTALNLALSPDRSVPESKAQMWCLGGALNSSRLGKDLPGWANQICSFNASHIGKHFKGQAGVPVEVTAVSLEELLRRSGIQNLQVLMIDTEGFDFAVLQQIPFERTRPVFVLWEHKHLHANQRAAENLMRSHCYAVRVFDSENTVAMALV